MPLPSTASSLSTYGGAKIDQYPIVDPEKDLAAAEHNQAMEDLAQASRMIQKGWVMWTGYPGSGSTTMTLVDHEALHGTSVAPVVVYSSDGYSQATYTVTLPATFTDGLGVEHSTNIRGAFSHNYYKTLDNAGGEMLDMRVKKLGPYSFKVVVRDPGTILLGSPAEAGDASTMTVFYT